jgi:uncharacterized membrane protein
MAWIGPIVRNEIFFFVVILGVAGLAILRQYAATPQSVAAEPISSANSAERRRLEWERRKQRRWTFAGAFAFLAVILLLTTDFVYARAASKPAMAQELVAVIHKHNGEYAVALDACQICGARGYRQEGDNIICRNCGAAMYAPSIGEAGGCNPIPVSSHVMGAQIVVDLSSLSGATAQIHP